MYVSGSNGLILLLRVLVFFLFNISGMFVGVFLFRFDYYLSIVVS